MTSAASPFEHPFLGALLGDAATAATFTAEADIAAMLRFEAALAQAQGEAGDIPAEAATAIAEACAAFRPDMAALAKGTLKDGVVVPDLVRKLRAAVGSEHAKYVHNGATSQDVIDTSLVLRLAGVLDLFDARLTDLADALAALDAAHGSQPLMAHTRMQAALPFTFADKLANWRRPLERARLRLAALRPELLVIQLGGPVGTRAELGENAQAVVAGTAARLGLNAGPVWQAQRDTLGLFAALLSTLTGALGKIGQDIALMAQSEVGEVKLSGSGGSSAMAHKSNPVRAEVLVALARFNAGLLGTLHQAIVHENERSGAAWTLEWLTLPQMAVATGAALVHARELVRQIGFADSA